jgi:soluble lytic murein transglycosylase
MAKIYQYFVSSQENCMQPAFRLFLVLSLTTGISHAYAATPSPEEYRKTFLQAEQFLNQDRDPEYLQLVSSLKNYVLYPYLHYQWLKKHLDNDVAIQAFLQEYPQTRYAQALRSRWLLQLGKTQQWERFNEQYRNTDDIELQCYSALAFYNRGETDTALNKAKQLWVSGKSLPASCDSLFELLKASVVFSSEMVWQRFHLALKLDNVQLANQLSHLLPANQQADAELWLKLHRQPELVSQADDWKQSYSRAANLFVHAINRWLLSDVNNALQVWDAEKANFNIPQARLDETEKHLATELAFDHDSRAYERLSQLADKDKASREWQIRAALYQQNWPQVDLAINSLPDEEKQQDKWQYWQARAWAMTGADVSAQLLFRQLADKRSYYGFLAAHQLSQPISLSDRPIQVNETDLQHLQGLEVFQVVAELLAIDRKAEAKKQWWFAINGLNQNELITAAKMAQQWQLPAVAIFTIAKANAWDDLDLRFPLLYNKQIMDSAKATQLDPAVIYGLIRQESAFDELAESPVGAKGLMQLMPKTAQQLAHDLKQEWRGDGRLFESDLNISYGSQYYKSLLLQFKGNHALSAAAYNAGANRVKHWLPQKQAMPGDVWVENIPYKETRNYVSSVLQYAFIYQLRLNRNSLKTAILSQEINPAKN